MSERLLAETAEAACSALRQLGWVFLGEPDGSRGTSWWLRGHQADQLVRVAVERNWDDENVIVRVEWRNFAVAPRVLRGVQELRIVTSGARADAESGVEAAMMRCLEIFRDVVEGSGVAGREYALSRLGKKGTT